MFMLCAILGFPSYT